VAGTAAAGLLGTPEKGFQKLVDRGGEAARIGERLLRIERRVFEEWRLSRGGTIGRQALQNPPDADAEEFERVLEAGRGCADAKAAAFCANVLALVLAVWRVAVTEGIEPTNNHAERLLRGGALWRKNAFGRHSAGGCRFVERILTEGADPAVARPPGTALPGGCLGRPSQRPPSNFTPTDRLDSYHDRNGTSNHRPGMTDFKIWLWQFVTRDHSIDRVVRVKSLWFCTDALHRLARAAGRRGVAELRTEHRSRKVSERTHHDALVYEPSWPLRRTPVNAWWESHNPFADGMGDDRPS
jgi:hypothetical protein